MKCMFCGEQESKVIDSRPTDEGTVIRRRRECTKCGRRFTTYEKIENVPVLVVKKDGRREPLDADKIKSGVLKACEKRTVTMKEIENLVDDIEKQIYNSLAQEITSHEIGEMVMSRLKTLDEVAYVRFASVYRQFKDINTFMMELNNLLQEK